MAGKTLTGLRTEREIGFPAQYGPLRFDKKPGHALMPHEVYRDLVVILLMTALIFLLTGFGVPALREPANPAAGARPDTLPDWYLLWSYGIFIVVFLLPEFFVLGISIDRAFYSLVLSTIPFVILLILPFIDTGFESRPAKAPIRTAIGVAGLAWVLMASIYSIGQLIIPFFLTTRGSLVTLDTLNWMFIVQPILAGIATYVAVRRLAFKPMRRVNTWANAGALFFLLVLPVVILGLVLGNGAAVEQLFVVENLWLGLYVALAVLTGFVMLYIVYFLDEGRGRRTLFGWIGLTLLILVPVSWYLIAFQQAIFDYVQVFIMTYSHIFIALPVFAIVVTYFGQRTPYSDYEYKLNECYQCGRCHLVCPITKVDADALGGLNLVYNVYKRQHDGVPMWACLTCDACSAVCPVDINYSAYVLTERARVMREKRRIPERPAATLPTSADGGRRT